MAGKLLRENIAGVIFRSVPQDDDRLWTIRRHLDCRKFDPEYGAIPATPAHLAVVIAVLLEARAAPIPNEPILLLDAVRGRIVVTLTPTISAAV
jgi:hypothetical protein